jgi:error-prone DNA polymerase
MPRVWSPSCFPINRTTLGAHLAQVKETFGERAYLALALPRPGDAGRLHCLDTLARAAGVRSVATGDVLYHSGQMRPLQDALAAIREHTTVDALGFKRERFMDRHPNPEEMERRFKAFPDAIQASAEIAAQCTSIWARSSTNIPMSR